MFIGLSNGEKKSNWYKNSFYLNPYQKEIYKTESFDIFSIIFKSCKHFLSSFSFDSEA